MPTRARIFWLALASAMTLFAIHAVIPFGGAGVDRFFADVLYNAILIAAAGACIARGVLSPTERAPWLLLGGGIAAWTLGDLLYTFAYNDDPPIPSVADALYLALYPAAYVGVGLLVRRRVQDFHKSLWLDGLIGAFAVASFAAALVFEPIADAAEGNAAAIATNLAYPVGDLLLLGMVVGVFALTGWRPSRAWVLLGAGFALVGVSDVAYLLQSANDGYVAGGPVDLGWLGGMSLIAYAAWAPARAEKLGLTGWRLLVAPALFALVATAMVTYDHFSRISDLALALAALTLIATIARMMLTFGENLTMTDHIRRESLTDALTGIGNRRLLMRDLTARAEAATPENPVMLALFDLDGFKGYNDAFGHPAGDQLLTRLGRYLETAVSANGAAYRMGGDEFCAILEVGESKPEALVAAASEALCEKGEGFDISASYGVVMIPSEVRNTSEALQMADQRMYAHKDSRPRSAKRQTRDVLLGVLRERQPDLHEHLEGVADLAYAVGTNMGLPNEELDVLARAAELHDVGKMAIPDAILDKPGPLDEREWGFMYRHTIIGERILGAAPALIPVAKIVRSSHERYDGAGYPDRLEGEAIPFGSRIVFACDALHAMTSDRSYRDAMPLADAVQELRENSGSQFDPRVVDALVEVVDGRVAAAADETIPDPVESPRRV